MEYLGNPPPNSLGLYFAVQALLFSRQIIFIRVKEEGYSFQDYFMGLKLLQRNDKIPHLEAIGIPGVGDSEIINALIPLCFVYHSILLITETDLYDYVMQERGRMLM